MKTVPIHPEASAGPEGPGTSFPSSSLSPMSKISVAQLIDANALVDDALRVLPVVRTAWAKRSAPRGTWFYQRSKLTDDDIAGMLQGRHWLACRAPKGGVIDRVVLDLDGPGHGHPLADRDDRYRAVREALGWDRVPLVYQTPGKGLHLAYRLPLTPIHRVITGESSGILAEALGGAGLPVAKGLIEIYPQERQVLRMPLGPNMPLLDPDTLLPIPGATIGDTYDEAQLRGAIEYMQEWYARPLLDLIPHLEQLAELGRGDCAASHVTADVGPSGAQAKTGDVGAEVVELIRSGLTRPASRHVVEFSVGVAAFQRPALLSRWGLPAQPSGTEVATALSRWLAAQHHGFSREWAAHRRRHASDEAAALAWAARYLQADEHGERPVDRMRRAADAVGPPRVPSVVELDWLFAQSVQTWGGQTLYRYEVWAVACLRAVRQILHWEGEHPRSGGWVQVQIKAEWMEEWPWGGARIEGRTAYVAFREAMARSGMLVCIRNHWHNPVEGLTGSATTYAMRVPETHDGAYLGRSVKAIQELLDDLRVDGQPVSIDAAVHAIFLHRSGHDLDRRYGPSIACDLRAVIRRLVPSQAFRS